MLAPAVGIAREQPFEQLVLGAEMAVDQAVRHAGFLGDRAQRNLVRAGRGEQALGGVEHRVGDLVAAGRTRVGTGGTGGSWSISRRPP